MKNKKIIVPKETQRLNTLICFIQNESFPDEVWKEVPCESLSKGHEKYIIPEKNQGVYFVSSYGRIVSLWNPDKAVLLLGTDKTNGYNQISIARIDGKCKCDRHILVAETFIGDTRKKEVHHKDFDNHNNRESNLEILTKPEHLRKHGKMPKEEKQNVLYSIQSEKES